MSSTRSGGVPAPLPGSAPLRALRRALRLFSQFLLVALLSSLVAAARADTTVGWRQLSVTGPSSRFATQMAYDGARDRTVLFGGTGFSGALSDTWEWDGHQWARVATTGPSPRCGAAMVYDAARGKILLFGGTNSIMTLAHLYNDTWTWDGTQWTQVASSGPSPRYNAAMAYDSARGKVVLAGGGSNDPNGLTWEWDGGQWTHPDVQEPSYRGGAAMAYDGARERTILFGGGLDYGNADTFEWDGSAWTWITGTGPSARYSSMVYDSARGKCVLFGGMADNSMTTFFGDTWEWDGTAWESIPGTGPGSRWGAAMAYDSKRHQVLLFGGWSNPPASVYSDTWVFSAVAEPFTLDDAVHVLQCCAGLLTLSEADLTRCDVETGGASSSCVDIFDACRIARKVAGLDANP